MVKRPSLAGPATAGIEWDPSRCRRVIRPLLTKLRALREDFKPPFTKPAKPRREHTPGADSYEEFAFPPSKKSRKLVRTYAMGRAAFPGSGAMRPTVGSVAVSTGKCRVSDYASSLELFEGRPAHWDSEEYYLVKGIPPDSQSLAVGLEGVCSSFAGTTDTRVVRLYQAIYVALDTFLLATAAAPTAGPATPSLAALAARQVAYCILATEDDELVWYDLARGFGKSGEYLRDIVRWHGIELLRDSIAEGLMGSKDGSAGMAGLCIGLCRKHGADREAESLLETLLLFDPTFSSAKMSQVMETMRLYFSASPHGFVPPSCVYRILKTNTPSIFSNPPRITSYEIQAVLVMASKDIDAVPGADEMIMKIIDSAFGFLGEDKISESNPRRSPKSKPLVPPRRERAGETISKVVKRLIKLTSRESESKAKTVLIHLVKGFLSQSGDAKARTEQVWGDYWPGLVATKLAAMTYVQQWSCDEKTCTSDCNRDGCFRESLGEIRGEIALCLETLCAALEDEGIMSAAEYLYECSRPVLASTTRTEHRTEMRAINSLVGRLLALISPSSASTYALMAPPVTPKTSSKPKPKVVIYTPRKPLTPEDEKWERRRYLIGELVLKVADHYQDSAKEFKDEWVKWAAKVEEKVIGLKIRLPPQTTFLGHDPGAGDDFAQFKKNSRKGWRYEEGLGIWTLTGHTPGRRRTGAKEEGIAVVIPHTTGRRSWRLKYNGTTGLGSSIDSTDTSASSESPAVESHQEWQEDLSTHQTSESEAETKVVSPKSHRKSRAILDSLAKFPRRSRRFIESTPVATRSDEISIALLRENLLPRLSEPNERPFSVLVERYVPSEDGEDGAMAIPDSSPMVSRLTRRNKPFPNLHAWESDATASSPGGVKPDNLPSSSAFSSPPASHTSDSEYTDAEPPLSLRTRPRSSRIALNTQEHTQNRTHHRHSAATDSIDDDEISVTTKKPSSPRRPRRKSYPSIPTLPSPGQSRRPKRRAARRCESGMKRVMVRKRSVVDIAREAELSDDELGM